MIKMTNMHDCEIFVNKFYKINNMICTKLFICSQEDEIVNKKKLN